MKKLLLIASWLFSTLLSYSQTFTPPPYADIDTTYRTHVNNVFGLLEPNRVATGLLLDYGFAFTNPKIYNGVVLHDSTLIESGIFSTIYQTLYTSRFNNNIVMQHPSIQDSLWNAARQEEIITLSGLLYRYNAIDPNANTNGTIDVANGQLKDKYINGGWQNPYQQFTTLAISPSITSYNLTYGSVRLPSGLWLSNMSSELSSIQFDADDGQGYLTVQMNTDIPFNYADTGWKHWVFRINLTNGQQLFTHTKVHISNISNLAGSGGSGGANRGTNLYKQRIYATKIYNGVYGMADIIVSYRNDDDRVLRKPLIVAEGLDLGHILKPEEPEGSNTYKEFIERIRNSNSNNLISLLANDPTSEFDIIYINWRNGSDYLQRNAYVLEEVITWVNSHKQPLNGVMQQNVVMGLSMGGVIARMALGDMERSNPIIPHDTRLYISVDGPQQGSNIPLGMQAATRHALKMYLKTGMLAAYTEVVALLPGVVSPYQALHALDQPGAKQLLIQRIDENYNYNNDIHTQFYNELRTQWLYPANTRNIIVSNGSECAIDQEFAPGTNLLYFDRNTKTRFIGDLFLMSASLVAAPVIGAFVSPFLIPGSQEFHAKLDIRASTNGGGNQVYYGKISYTKKILWLVPVTITVAEKTYNAPTGLPAYDTYPGSFFKLTMNNSLNGMSQDWMFSYDNTFQVQRRFTHVLTTSALDIGGGNVPLSNAQYFAKYVGENPPLAPYNVPQEINNFTTAYNQNPLIFLGPVNPTTNQPSYQFISTGSEEHTQFYLRNANFMAAELNGITTQRVNCSAYCDGGVSNWPSSVCTTPQVFTVPGVSTGTTVTWSASPSGIVSISPNGSSATVSPTGSGQTTITATLTGDAINVCGTKVFSKQITVGGTTIELISFSNGFNSEGYFCTSYMGNQFEYLLSYVSENTAIEYRILNWPALNVVYTSPIQYPANGLPVTVEYIPSPGWYVLEARTISACGSTEWAGFEVEYVDCSTMGNNEYFRIQASPNPTSSDLYVSIDQEKPAVKALGPSEKITCVLYDFSKAKAVKEWNFLNNQKQYKLNVTGIKPGQYILVVTKGKYRQTTQILIQ